METLHHNGWPDKQVCPDERQWAPCFVDPWRGVAHFDGLTIEADPITSSRIDRVLPCIEDEQIFFCRMLTQHLAGNTEEELNNRKALDIGTGSGVLAVAGASMGLQVHGIDINDRSRLFTELNKARNNEKIISANGSLKWQHLDFFGQSEILAEWEEGFDYIFLNAPFALVPNDTIAPVSVNGGIDGQSFFNRAVEQSNSLLKPGGKLFAIHLLRLGKDGMPSTMDNQPTLENDWWGLDILPALMPSRKNLEDFVSELDATRSERTSLGERDSLCFAFIILCKKKNNEIACREPFIHETLPLIAPPLTWADRLHMHRIVLRGCPQTQNNTEADPQDNTKANPQDKTALLPASQFYLARTSPFFGSAKNDSNREITNNDVIDNDILDWVLTNDLIGQNEDQDLSQHVPSFEVLMIEAAPWYLSLPAHNESNKLILKSTTSIISKSRSDETSLFADKLSSALQDILNNIIIINNDNRSIFRHPAQLTKNNDHWNTAIELVHHIPLSDPINGTSDQAPNDSSNDRAVKTEPRPLSKGSLWLVSNVTDLQALGVPPKNTSQEPFDKCVRQGLAEITNILLQHNLLSCQADKYTVHIVGIPIPPVSIKSNNASRSSNEQTSLNGIVYAYGWAAAPWSPEAEMAIADFGRIGALLYEERFTGTLKDELKRLYLSIGIEDTLRYARHDLSYIIHTAIRPNLPERTATLLRNYFQTVLQQNSDASQFVIRWPDICSDFTGEMRRLWVNCFAVYKLSGAGQDTDQLDIELEKYEKEAKLIYTIQNDIDSIRLKDISKDSNFHFSRAVVAGLMNAAKHIRKAPELKPTVQVKAITIDSKHCIVIQSQYRYDSKEGAEKRIRIGTRQASDKSEMQEGTFQVIRYHISKYHRLPKDYEVFRSSLEEVESEKYLVTWDTIILCPSSSLRG